MAYFLNPLSRLLPAPSFRIRLGWKDSKFDMIFNLLRVVSRAVHLSQMSEMQILIATDIGDTAVIRSREKSSSFVRIIGPILLILTPAPDEPE